MTTDSIPDGGPAFPCTSEETVSGDTFYYDHAGISVRDYFAARCVGPILSAMLEDKTAKDPGKSKAQSVADAAYLIADAMLKARQA